MRANLVVLGCLLWGCANHKPLMTFPVQLSKGFTLPTLLTNHVDIESISDIESLISGTWYASIEVEGAASPTVEKLDSCQSYFEIQTADLRAKKYNENSALIDLLVQCEAADALRVAKSARESYLPSDILGADLVKLLPKTLALIISTNEHMRVLNDSSIVTWSDAAGSFTSSVDESQVEYHFADGSIQSLAVVGRGDLNHDGIEDVLLTSTDSVDGGDYFNIRLFAVTVRPNLKWELISI